MYLKGFVAKCVISISVDLNYLCLKLLKCKENNKKMRDTVAHNFKNIPVYMSQVSFERHYFVLYNGALALKFKKMALNPMCDETLHLKSFIAKRVKRHF